MKRIIGLMLLSTGISCALTSCATKNYGRQPTLTEFEKRSLSCREIDLEQAKVQGFLTHVHNESEFDGRSVLSFLGDFGIGNLMERSAAVDSANQRMAELSNTKTKQGCSYANAASSQFAPAPAQQAVDGAGKTKAQQIEELGREPGISYQEYQRRYREIMGQ